MEINFEEKSRNEAQKAIGAKGDQAVVKLAPLIKSSKVTVIIRFVFCNLSYDSELLLADAFAANTHLVGFTCIQNPHNFQGINYRPTASVQKLEEAAARCRSRYFTRFQNEELSEDLKTTRNQSVNIVHTHNKVEEEDDEDTEIIKLREKLERLERNRAEKAVLRKQELDKLEQQAATLLKSEQGLVESLPTSKEKELKLQQECRELQQTLDQVKSKLHERQQQLRNIQQDIKTKLDARDKCRKDLKATNDSIEKLRILIQKENNSSSPAVVKVLEEDRDFERARVISLFEVNERLTREQSSEQNLCDICKENEKDVVIQCGHRMCKSCLDSWCLRNPNNQVCPFCKLPIQTVTRCFN